MLTHTGNLTQFLSCSQYTQRRGQQDGTDTDIQPNKYYKTNIIKITYMKDQGNKLSRSDRAVLFEQDHRAQMWVRNSAKTPKQCADTVSTHT